MSKIAIKAENISKTYRLGEIGTGTISRDLERFWKVKIQGKEDPFLKINSHHTQHKDQNQIVHSLKDINFEIYQGEAIGIIGRNGAGKSTLLKILSRITAPTTGVIKIKGRLAALLEVGTGFHPELTGRENIYLNGTILGMRKAEITQKFDEIVDFSGVEKYIDTPVKRYSSGMYVRLAFAVAAYLEPEILVVDEVLAVGDAEFQKKCMGKMNDVSRLEGRTILFVSHNMAAISNLTSKSLVLEQGNILFYGETNKAIYAYQSLSKNKLSYLSTKKESDNIPFIKKVSVITSEGTALHQHGATLKIVFEIYAPTKIPKAAISFQIFNEMQIPCVQLWYFGTNQPFLTQKGLHILTCTIPKLRLYQGHYTLKVYFAQFGGDTFEILSEICPFEVSMLNQKRDFPWQAGACTYLEDSEWNIENG